MFALCIYNIKSPSLSIFPLDSQQYDHPDKPSAVALDCPLLEKPPFSLSLPFLFPLTHTHFSVTFSLTPTTLAASDEAFQYTRVHHVTKEAMSFSGRKPAENDFFFTNLFGDVDDGSEPDSLIKKKPVMYYDTGNGSNSDDGQFLFYSFLCRQYPPRPAPSQKTRRSSNIFVHRPFLITVLSPCILHQSTIVVINFFILPTFPITFA